MPVRRFSRGELLKRRNARFRSLTVDRAKVSGTLSVEDLHLITGSQAQYVTKMVDLVWRKGRDPVTNAFRVNEEALSGH